MIANVVAVTMRGRNNAWEGMVLMVVIVAATDDGGGGGGGE